MDTTETITHVGLCAGYGGIELGLKRVLPTLRTVAFCEIEAFACANLVAKMEAGLMDPAPVWTDLKTFPWAEFSGRVDILSGGYPCQPFSAAGLRKGTDDPRHLWPFISAGIAAMRPSLCFFENVEGHISLGLPDVIEDLGRLGYRTTWGIFSAAEVGAPHQRKRVFIMAISSGFRSAAGLSGPLTRHEGITGIADHCGAQDIWPSRPGEPQHAWEPPRVVGNAEGGQDNGREPRDLGKEATEGGCGNDAADGSGESVGNAETRTRFGQTQGTAGHTAQPDEGMGNAQVLDGSGQTGGQWQAQTGRTDTAWDDRQTQPTLGGNTDGPTSGLDYAIVFAADCQPCECCDDVICWKCGGHYADCPCPGPNSSDD